MIYKATLDAADFDGATPETGRFAPGGTERKLQVRINSILFTTDSTIASWSLRLVDPSDGKFLTLLENDGADDAEFVFQPNLMLPTNDDGEPWRVEFLTTTMAGEGTIWIDADTVQTEG